MQAEKYLWLPSSRADPVMRAHRGMFLHTSLLPPPITLKFTLASEREGERSTTGNNWGREGFRTSRWISSASEVPPKGCFPALTVGVPPLRLQRCEVSVQSCRGGDYWFPGTGHVEPCHQAPTFSRWKKLHRSVFQGSPQMIAED